MSERRYISRGHARLLLALSNPNDFEPVKKSTKMLSRQCHLSMTYVAHSIQLMKNDGLVEVIPCKDDEALDRSNSYVVTARGKYRLAQRLVADKGDL